MQFSFSCCFLVCLSPTQKRQKQKMPFSVRRPHFLHPDNFAKTVFWHPYTLSVILNIPNSTLKLGIISKTILDQMLTLNLDQSLTYKAPNRVPDIDSTAKCMYMYMYIYIYTRVVGLVFWPSLALFCVNPGQVELKF